MSARPLALMVGSSLLVWSCTAEPGASPPLSERSAEELTATLGHASVHFTACDEDPDFECGAFEVPVRYDRPHGERLSLAVIRGRATGPGTRLGAIFLNNGGPGGSGVDYLFFRGHTRLAKLRERFDLVSFDPRGVGRSRPVRCDFDPPAKPTTDDPEARAQYLDEYARRFAQACQEQTGAFATEVGTNNVARDIDRFRDALGENTLSFHGVSYGSELGAVYASLFPRRVRAMVLDGPVFDTFGDYTREAFTEQAMAHELTLQRLGKLCSRDPACPLAGRDLPKTLDQVLDALQAHPVPSSDGTFLIGRDEAAMVILSLLVTETAWRFAPQIIAAAAEGNYGPLQDFAFPLDDRLPPELQPYAAILCTDLGSRRSATDFLPALEATEAQFPRVGRLAEFELLLRTCQAWPEAKPPIFRNVARELRTPILIIGNDFDPATPLAWGRRLGRALGMEDSVLRYRGGGHTATSAVFRGVPCIDDIAYRYLFDLEVPAPGTSCPQRAITFEPLASKRSPRDPTTARPHRPRLLDEPPASPR